MIYNIKNKNVLLNLIFNLLLIFFNIYFSKDFNIYLLLTSLDNISYALNFIIININNKLSYSDIIDKNNSLYLLPLFERYLFYGFITIIYYAIQLLILRDYIFYIKIILSIASLPNINNIIYNKYYNIFNNIKQNKERIIKLIFCEQICNIIKKLNKNYIDDKIVLDNDEIIKILMESQNFKSEIITFIKNTLIVVLLNYFKSKSYIYYKITKYIYIYNSGNYYINNIDIDQAKQKFITIFKNKDYTKLNDPMTIHSMLYLYYNKKTETDWNILYTKIKYNILSFVTLWTFCTFFKDIYKLYILILISFCLRIAKKNIKNTFNKKYIISLLFSILGYYILNSIVIISFIHQFGYYLYNNFITKGILNSFYNNFYLHIKNNYVQIIYILHKNFISYIRNILYGFILKFLFMYNISYGYAFILFITNSEKCVYIKLLYICLYISIFNKKNIIQLFLLSYICTILINLIKNIDDIKNIKKNNISNIMLHNNINKKINNIINDDIINDAEIENNELIKHNKIEYDIEYDKIENDEIEYDKIEDDVIKYDEIKDDEIENDKIGEEKIEDYENIYKDELLIIENYITK